MRSPLALPFAFLCVVLVWAPGSGAEEGEGETARLLGVVRRERDVETWQAAVKTLMGGTLEQQRRVRAVLEKLASDHARVWAKEASRVRALAANLEEGKTSRRRREAWEEARRHAQAWLFDEVRFPVPAESLITGPKQGYEEARKRGAEADLRWRSLVKRLDRALAPAFRLSAKDALALRKARDDAEAAHVRVAAALGGLAVPRDKAVDPRAEALLALRLGERGPLHARYAALEPGWEKLCLFRAWCRHVTSHNALHPYDMRADALLGLEAMNGYRVALGISPVRHDPRLVRAAEKHSEEMSRRGYFSHRSPVPERETKEKRAAIEGYVASVVECITGVGGGRSAIEFWKYDGGHHRDMIHPRWVEGGFGTRGPAVYVGGMGDASSWPVLCYPQPPKVTR